MTRTQAAELLIHNPIAFGHAVGFDKLGTLHNAWIQDMVRGSEDKTLQAHRGSYKTTCVSIALAEIIVLLPNLKTLFVRKTDADVKEVVRQVRNLLLSPYMEALCEKIHGKPLILTTVSATEISTNLAADNKGTSQLVACGVNGSLTGKHFDKIFTDDIVNVDDRISKAERDHTKLIYQELANIKNRGGRIYNTGTPWHKDDAFSIMPEAEKWDCYSTGMINADELQTIKDSMTASLFAANYELRHIAEEDVIFENPQTGADPCMVEQGDAHIDAAYGGEDFTAFTICKKHGEEYYIFGKLWRKHVDDVLEQCVAYRQQFNSGRIYCEDNGDKGYLAKDLRGKGERVVKYHESQNKHIKICSYLKTSWKHVHFVDGTDTEYINQICDYNENSEHDDAPDSCASIIRQMFFKKDTGVYKSPFGG